MICKGCDKRFYKECNYKRHMELSLACKRVEDLILENEKLTEENKLLKKIKRVEGLDNIDISELNINKLGALDLVEYGVGIAKFIINKTNIMDKIILREKKKRILIYKIDNEIYRDYGDDLVYFLISNYKDKMRNYLENLYGDENINSLDLVYNEHIKRMINIKDIELSEILTKKNINNNLSDEIIDSIINYLKSKY